MGLKLLHTADWQIGMKAAQLGSAAAAARKARLDTARRIADLARIEKADAAVLAGDTFENHAVALSDVDTVASILGSFSCPVLILPGNHDPLTPGGIWDLPVWHRLTNVTVARLPEPVVLDSCVLFPCPLGSRWGAGDPTGWIPAGQHAGAIRIGVAHGPVAGLPNQDQTRTIPADAPAARRLDYLALGDWHSVRLYSGADQAVRMAYSGTPEPTSFGEDASGHVLIVEIDAPGAAPRVRQEKVAQLAWFSQDFEVREPGDLAILHRQLQQRAGKTTVAEVRLRGTLFPEALSGLDAIQALENEFLFFRVKDDLIPMLRFDDLPDGPLRQTAQRLEALSRDPQQSAEARLALHTLLTQARGAGA